ncbi:transcription initiation factor IIB [Candidatus Bathyarchaeota archaeon]|nr:MAG: transcription initiation factor IIB [Candidatus Bathyarchaeota archaeon]
MGKIPIGNFGEKEMNKLYQDPQTDTGSNCPHCGGTRIVSDRQTGEMICANCGLVVTDTIMDTGPEYRVFNLQEANDRRRTGTGYSMSIYDKGLSTVIKGDKDASGKRLDYETQRRMRRLQRQDNRSKVNETHARNLSIAMAELDRMASELHLPQNVKENAALIYRKALKEDLIRGRSIDAFVAASLYAACRLQKIPRPLKEVSKVSKRLHSEVAMTYRLIHKELKLRPPVDGPFKFIPSIAAKLSVNQPTEQLAINILKKADEIKALTGKDPRGLAAAALYMACQETKEKRVQRVIAKAAGTTEVTLRNRYRGLKQALDQMETTPEDLVLQV